MNDPTRQEDFEVYPYAEPEPSDPVPAPPPSVVSRAAGPAVAGPVVSGPGGMGRRGLILGVIGAGALGLIGLGAVQRGAGGPEFGPGYGPDGSWTSDPVPVDETVGEVVATLQTADGDIYVEVPGDWEVLSEFDLLHLRHTGGAELVARIPDRPSPSSTSQLRIEADYTRTRFVGEFTPGGDVETSREDNPPFECFVLRSSGELAGQEATELVDYQVDTSRERSIVVSALWSQSGDIDVMEQAVQLSRELLDGFQAL